MERSMKTILNKVSRSASGPDLPFNTQVEEQVFYLARDGELRLLVCVSAAVCVSPRIPPRPRALSVARAAGLRASAYCFAPECATAAVNMQSKRRKVMQSEGRQMIASVYHFLKTEYEFTDKIAFNGCLETLRTLLKKLGYDWRKTDKNKKVMLERHDIQLWRLKYIEQVTEYRSRGRPIVYTNESYVLTTHVRSACSDAGFLDKLCLVYEANSATGDYTSKVNFDNYVKWLDEQLLPNLPAQSVVVLDSYHRTRAEKLPTSTSSRSEMQQWLTAKDIQFDSDLLKVELYDIIKKHRSNFMTYKIDDYIKSKGFEVLRLPPYHPELNAMEKIWGVIKHCVALKTVEQNAVNTEELILESIENLSSETWSEAFEGVVQKEAEYMAYLDTELDFTFNLQDDSDENETVSEESASDSN
ncbi:hypothetical protein PYW07_004866 [Mythimna separata]|uniref:Tc1-like transposase DDE domain-containing protein n=1 Tax=Mythimna separata TaxID=271217 RepID=A0AAD7YDA9_MYTSE|nr:hypothetical protein PYW07_004866 [Mythimna separata]